MAKNVGKIIGINGNMVSVETDSQVSLNEVGYLLLGDQKLKAEVIRISGKKLELQVFEATSGIGIGNEVEFSGDLLTVELGPGLLKQIYDGLQNPLPELAEQCGFFLQRGIYLNALPRDTKWDFTPSVKPGDNVTN
ncbi:MAG: V-type ATP synthase subunit A, partial [Spirochaetales bacterium]|nr:V-type ATP synthase subunit A [Spirochaetales bacterium]